MALSQGIKKIAFGLMASVLFSAQALASGGAPARGYTETDHPIVMIGGFLAFDDILGINYFYQIPGDLANDGAKVYPVNVAAFSSTYERGEQLINKLEELKATKGHSKFNLMGHSGGATTIRYVAGARPDLVASVTSIHGSNTGVPLADILQEGSISASLLGSILDIAGTVVEFLGGHDASDYPQNGVGMLTDYRTDVTAAFNAEYSDGMPTTQCGEGAHFANGVRYYSWGGTSSFTNPLDLLDPMFAITGLLTGGANDGLIPQCASHLGDVIRDDYPHNHVDAMNHIFGLRGLFTPDPKQLYRQQANRLQSAGL
jgi:triacylglycerol lipase